jgi:hypothetical protein
MNGGRGAKLQKLFAVLFVPVVLAGTNLYEHFYMPTSDDIQGSDFDVVVRFLIEFSPYILVPIWILMLAQLSFFRQASTGERKSKVGTASGSINADDKLKLFWTMGFKNLQTFDANILAASLFLEAFGRVLIWIAVIAGVILTGGTEFERASVMAFSFAGGLFIFRVIATPMRRSIYRRYNPSHPLARSWTLFDEEDMLDWVRQNSECED